jgi:hypothetical protein
MTSAPDLYDANLPSAGFTIDTTGGPVDMVAVIYRLEGRKGLRLTRAELDVVEAVKHRYKQLRMPPRSTKRERAAAYRALAYALADAA